LFMSIFLVHDTCYKIGIIMIGSFLLVIFRPDYTSSCIIVM